MLKSGLTRIWCEKSGRTNSKLEELGAFLLVVTLREEEKKPAAPMVDLLQDAPEWEMVSRSGSFK